MISAKKANADRKGTQNADIVARTLANDHATDHTHCIYRVATYFRDQLAMLISVLLAVASYQLASAQAPGDTSQVCLDLRAEGIAILGYPPNVKPLMDSRNYENLLPFHQSPVWQRVDRDNNNPVGQSTTVSLPLVVFV